MPVTTKFGRQPVLTVLHENRWEVKRFARENNLNLNHFYNVVTGRVAVSRELQQALPDLLGVPIDALFSERSIREGNHSRVALITSPMIIETPA